MRPCRGSARSPVYSAPVSDHSLALGRPAEVSLLPHLDVEGKVLAAVDPLGAVRGSDVVIVDPDTDALALALEGLGARTITVGPPLGDGPAGERRPDPGHAHPTGDHVTGDPRAMGLPDECADVIVGAYSVYRGVDGDELREADRVLRAGGRHLVVHDYGRDEVSALFAADRPEVTTWSRRDGPFLRAGFKIRVVHCWWTFATLEEAADVLGAAFGARGASLAATLRRPRLSWNAAIYHRVRGPL
jgi:hypothetical protein